MYTTTTETSGKFFGLVRAEDETTLHTTPGYITEAMALADAKCWAAFHGGKMSNAEAARNMYRVTFKTTDELGKFVEVGMNVSAAPGASEHKLIHEAWVLMINQGHDVDVHCGTVTLIGTESDSVIVDMNETYSAQHNAAGGRGWTWYHPTAQFVADRVAEAAKFNLVVTVRTGTQGQDYIEIGDGKGSSYGQYHIGAEFAAYVDAKGWGGQVA
jgi:hypothetical protein